MKWRIIKRQRNNAFMNLALEEACMEGIENNESPPTIRLYQWSNSAVVIGRFQSLDEEIALDKCQEWGVDYTRRITGGGAMFLDKDGELTYGVIAPRELFPKNIIESYKEICGWIIKALEYLDIKSEFKPINDIITNGKKISGNAQTRRGNVLLHHGTILHHLDIKKMFTLLKVPEEKISDKMIQNVEDRVTCLSKIKPEITTDQIEEALIKSFTENKEYEFSDWTEKEIKRANELVKEKYNNKSWNHQR